MKASSFVWVLLAVLIILLVGIYLFPSYTEGLATPKSISKDNIASKAQRLWTRVKKGRFW